ncbi:MAG: hypothetical protein AB4057_02940 [Crocosphaera sp.]
MWLSVREIRKFGDPEWDDYINFIGLPNLREIRSIDSWCNPLIDDSFYAELLSSCNNYSLDNLGLSSIKELELIVNQLPKLTSSKYYYLLIADSSKQEIDKEIPYLKFLGYDLSDETWTSSLLNCGKWEGELMKIAQRVNQYGLLNWEDAILARSKLPQAWNNDHHAFVTIWELYEVIN